MSEALRAIFSDINATTPFVPLGGVQAARSLGAGGGGSFGSQRAACSAPNFRRTLPVCPSLRGPFRRHAGFAPEAVVRGLRHIFRHQRNPPFVPLGGVQAARRLAASKRLRHFACSQLRISSRWEAFKRHAAWAPVAAEAGRGRPPRKYASWALGKGAQRHAHQGGMETVV